MARCIGHHCHRHLETGLVQRIGGLLDHQRVGIAIGPGDVLEIELEAVVLVLLAVDQQRFDHALLGRFVMHQLVEAVAAGGHRQDRHHAQIFLLGDVVQIHVGRAVDQAVLIHAIPGGHHHIDLVDIGQERIGRFLRVHQIEQRRRVLGQRQGGRAGNRQREQHPGQSLDHEDRIRQGVEEGARSMRNT